MLVFLMVMGLEKSFYKRCVSELFHYFPQSCGIFIWGSQNRLEKQLEQCLSFQITPGLAWFILYIFLEVLNRNLLSKCYLLIQKNPLSLK